jgi:hypothetical protein
MAIRACIVAAGSSQCCGQRTEHKNGGIYCPNQRQNDYCALFHIKTTRLQEAENTRKPQEIFISMFGTETRFGPKRGESFRTRLRGIAAGKITDCFRSRVYSERPSPHIERRACFLSHGKHKFRSPARAFNRNILVELVHNLFGYGKPKPRAAARM